MRSRLTVLAHTTQLHNELVYQYGRAIRHRIPAIHLRCGFRSPGPLYPLEITLLRREWLYSLQS